MVSTTKYSATLIFLACFLIVSTYVIILSLNDLYSGLNTDKVNGTYLDLYKKYLSRFNKSYDAEETKLRFEVFKKSMKEIRRLNQQGGARYGWTKFTDVYPEEIFGTYTTGAGNALYGMSKPRNEAEDDCPDDFREWNIPDYKDWRETGKVGAVLDQKLCNACWAISIVGLMESMTAIQKQESIVSLSIQELLDCKASPNEQYGCKGGSVLTYMHYMYTHNVSVVRETEYPLTLKDEECRLHNLTAVAGRKLSCYKYHSDNNGISEEDILRLVSHHGPVMVIVNSDPWRHYLGGVISHACYRSKDLSAMFHVVQIVGFDRTAPVPHYIIKNSWGEGFGIEGYLHLKIGMNLCGVADDVAFLRVY